MSETSISIFIYLFVCLFIRILVSIVYKLHSNLDVLHDLPVSTSCGHRPGPQERPEYKAFNARVPRQLRQQGQPMTPDPRAYPSKRQWETAAQKWREDLHVASCGMVEFPDAEGV